MKKTLAYCLQRPMQVIAWILWVISMLLGCRRAPGEVIVVTPTARGAAATAEAALTAQAPQVRGTPTPAPTRKPPESTAVYYTVRYGDTLTGIAAMFGTTTEDLMRLNGLSNADQLSTGQTLQIALEAQYTSPADVLIPDSELIYGPAYVEFDTEQGTASFTGMFTDYAEEVGGKLMTGTAIIDRVAEQYSVGPRVLLTLLELRGGWLTNPEPTPEQRQYPLGYTQFAHTTGLYQQLCIAANTLNIGFYGWRLDTLWLVQLDNGEHVQFSTQLNAGTAGIQRALAGGAADYESWTDDLKRFDQIYRRLFGNPFQYTVEPLIPEGVEAPTLALPWAEGETWYFTGGPHPGWGTQGAWSALDFATSERNLGCMTSQYWVTASAPGKVMVSENGMVLQDLDDDGFVGTGWVLLYMHIASDGRVPAGSKLSTGDRVGHPSCEGGVSNATHVHFARRYNGLWIPADDAQWTLTLSGWAAVTDELAYDGRLVKGGQTRVASETWGESNAIQH